MASQVQLRVREHHPEAKVARLLSERFRCFGDTVEFGVSQNLSHASGYFRCGEDAIGYGQCSSGSPAPSVTHALHDAREQIVIDGSSVYLPFDPTQVIDNLLYERYSQTGNKGVGAANSKLRRMYYAIRPLMPVAVRRPMQRHHLRGWEGIPFPQWPVDRTIENLHEQLLVLSMKAQKVNRVPFIWFWPDGLPSCSMMTHDVETAKGISFCPALMDLNDSFGIKTSFNIIPEQRYPVPDSLLEGIRKRGFEINVHDLNHDGNLFRDRGEFVRRAQRINQYRKRWGVQGFRSAVLYRNVDWYDALDVDYDMSIPNVAHLDPQRGGCCTVLPFQVGNTLELPLTTTQDYSLFHILNQYSLELWKQQISLIREKHGLISFIVHPDYIIAARARKVYSELLHYLSGMRDRGETWIALPSEVADWWRLRSKLSLVREGDAWRIEGQGRERARVAYAVRDGDQLTYEL